MKQTKNSIILLLMISSIVLLLVLQVLWITNSYEKAYFDLRRETNILFRNTVFALRDSSFEKNIEQLPPDSVGEGQFLFTQKTEEPVFPKGIKRAREIRKDIRLNSSQVQIYISSSEKGSSKDSIKAFIRPLASRFGNASFSDGGRFIIRMGPDSLSIDTLRQHFKKSLAQANINVPFDIESSSFLPTPTEFSPRKHLFRDGEEEPPHKFNYGPFSNHLVSDWVRYTPVHRYSVALSSFRSLLIKQITPQLFFSTFLTLITITAFVILYRSIRSQQRLMELKNDFISNMTHELKTPIATVSVALEALKNFNGIDNPKLTAEYLDIAQHELNRLTILTDKVLKTSLFENNGVDFVAESVDMEKTIGQVFNSMKLVFEKQKASVSLEKEGTDFVVQGGTIHLTNVVYNLLDNALKYSKAFPSVLVGLKDTGEKIVLTVKDQGIGIASEFQKKIFEKFFRVPNGDVHNIKGYGLGLNYVASVVKSHHGNIEVESEEGKGSTFIITLPKRR